ncbi:hypothetical protein T484DRAFT_3629631 [Baffinella frigidus]|nr:hypothetical protein T484DRAFT_3629631 [Cryptophyta sp. CCMP2293]
MAARGGFDPGDMLDLGDGAGGGGGGEGGGDDGDAMEEDPGPAVVPAAKKRKAKGPSADANADDADGKKALVDDPLPEDDIKGADGQYALFPEGHQPRFHLEGSAEKLLCFGGRRWTRSSKAWQRLKIDEKELCMKASKEKYFRVAPPHTQNTTRHFHHAGPHLCMVFDITEQSTPDAGDLTLKILCFLVHMVNQAMNLRGCLTKTHYTDLDIAPGKGKAVCGLFYHGGHRKGRGGISTDRVGKKGPPEDGDDRSDDGDEEMQDAAAAQQDAQAALDEENAENDTVREVSPLSLFIKVVPVTYDLTKDGSVVHTETLMAIATVVPAPCVDVFNCFEKVTHGCSCAPVRDERQMLYARLRLHLIDIDGMRVGERCRRLPNNGVNKFVQKAHELEATNTIEAMLNKRHGNNVTNLKIVGMAHPRTAMEREEHKFACEHYLSNAVAWRTRLASALLDGRQDVCSAFPFIPRVAVWDSHEEDERMDGDEHLRTDKIGYIEGVFMMEFTSPLDDPPLMRWADFQVGAFPESVQAAIMRFVHRCDMDGQTDPSFLLDKNSRKPLENFFSEFHDPKNASLNFAHPKALKSFISTRERQQSDKNLEGSRANSLFELADITRSGQLQAFTYGSLVLATHIAHIKSGYYMSDTVKGMEAIVTYLKETNQDGCQLHRLLCAAKASYEEDVVAGISQVPTVQKGPFRDVAGVQLWRNIHATNMLHANRFYTMHATNLNVFLELLTSSCGHFFDGGGLWEFLMTGRDGIVCMYNRKTTSSGLDTIICGAIDDLFSAPSRILGLSKSLNLESKNVLRCTAVGIERMPKVRVTESGEVGEPPDSQIRYLPITMTEMRHMSSDLLDALLRLLFRDRRGENAIVLSTDVNKTGRRERKQAEKWNTLHPVVTFMPTGNNEDYTKKKAKSMTDGNVSASDRNARKIPSGEDMVRITSVLFMSGMMAGGMIGLMQQSLHPRCLKGNFNRAYRVCLARAMADHTVDRVLNSFSRHKDFNKAFDEVTSALEVNCIEPSGVMKFTHTALRQTIDMPFFVISKTIVEELNVPVLPLEWLKTVVKQREVDLDHGYAVAIREWVLKRVARNQLLPATKAKPGFNGSVRVSPYISSPCTPDGNVADSRESMLCVDNVNGTEAFSIACNMQSHLAGFFHVSNIDNEARNIVPALNKHAAKVCDFEPFFDMAPVLNVKFFLGLFFSPEQLRQLPPGLFNEAISDRPVCGMFARMDKVPEGAQGRTAYGMHVAVAIIVAAVMGPDMPVTPDCNTFLASKITKQLLNYTPPTMLHPSGTNLVLRGFTGKNVQQCELETPVRTDTVARSFFLRQRNDTSFSNKCPTMSMLDSPMRPYMFEDVVHVGWIAFLEKNHSRLVQEWNKKCLNATTNVSERVVGVNSTLNGIVLSDLYRTLDPSMLPCDDTLLYGVPYPIIGTGVKHTTRLCGWSKVLGYVVMHNAESSQIHIFETEADEVFQNPQDDEDEGQENLTGDLGCCETDIMVKTVDVFDTLRKKHLLVQPVIARPSAVLYNDRIHSYGTLQFNLSTGQCYDATTGKYTLRVPDAENEMADEFDIVDGVAMVPLNPIEVEQALIGVPTFLLADSRGFIEGNGLPDQRLPIGAASRTYIKGILWYPQCTADYTPDNVYLLVHTGDANANSYDMMSCNVSFLVHPEAIDDTWQTISTVRTL